MKLIKKICCLTILAGCITFFAIKCSNEYDAVYDSFFKEVQDELAKNETSIDDELSKMKEEYALKLEKTNVKEQQEKISEIIRTLDESDALIKKGNSNNKFKCYSVIRAMTALYHTMNLKLSPELLTYTISNKITDSLYSPIEIKALKAPYIFEITKDIKITSSSDDYTISYDKDNVRDLDLYYSIYNFQFNKNYIDESYICLHLRKRYDFSDDLDDTDIVKMGNKLLAQYQKEGLIKPFIVDMKDMIYGKVPVAYDFKDEIVEVKGFPEYSYDNVYIPSQITDVKTYVDESGATIKDVKRIQSSSFAECQNLVTLNIPSFIKEIGIFAFAECSNLKEIIINGDDVEIDDYAFYKCENLTKVIINGSNVHITDSTFDGCNLKEIIVPSKLVDFYRSDSFWSSYSSIINNN